MTEVSESQPTDMKDDKAVIDLEEIIVDQNTEISEFRNIANLSTEVSEFVNNDDMNNEVSEIRNNADLNTEISECQNSVEDDPTVPKWISIHSNQYKKFITKIEMNWESNSTKLSICLE
jgi:hypothetical protein